MQASEEEVHTRLSLGPFLPRREDLHLPRGAEGVRGEQSREDDRELDTYEKRKLAVDSLRWEAQWRMLDPVEGCFGEVKRLRAELCSIKNIFGPQDCSIKNQGGIGKPENLNPCFYTNSTIDNNVANSFSGVLNSVRGSSQPFLFGFNRDNCGSGQILYQVPPIEDADQQ